MENLSIIQANIDFLHRSIYQAGQWREVSLMLFSYRLIAIFFPLRFLSYRPMVEFLTEVFIIQANCEFFH